MMKFGLKRFVSLITFSSLCILVIAGFVYNRAMASSPWLGTGSPNLVKAQQLPDNVAPNSTNIDKTYVSYKIDGSSTMYSGYGTVGATATSVNGRFLVNGTSKAGLVTPWSIYQNPQMVPGTSQSYSYTSSSSAGFYLFFWKNTIASITKSDGSGGTISYAYNRAADARLNDKSGNAVLVNVSLLAFSQNGRYMIADVPNVATVRVDLNTYDVLPFAPSITTVSTNVEKLAISNDGTMASIAYGNYIGTTVAPSFKLYDLTTCAAVPSTITGPVSCQNRNLTTYMSAQISNLRTIERLRFESSNVMNIIATYSETGFTGFKAASYQLTAPGIAFGSNGYLALGDSFSSGEGAFNYLYGTDSSPQNLCHTSLQSYPYLINSAVSFSSFHTIACSGAVIGDVDTQSQHPTLPNGIDDAYWHPGTNPQETYVVDSQPSVVTISIGGNDIGFSDIVKTCVKDGDTCYTTKESRIGVASSINKQFDKLVALYSRIKLEAATNAKIYVVGYPQIVSSSGSCQTNALMLDSSERDFANKLVTYFDSVVKMAAQNAGVQYVDIENSLSGHELCDSIASQDIAVNGFTFGRDAKAVGLQVVGNESFHPNFLGQQLMSKAVLNATSNMTQAMPSTVTSNVPQDPKSSSITDSKLSAFLNVPASGVTQTYPTPLPHDDATNVLYKSSNWSTTVNTDTSIILAPNSSYNVAINSTPTSLGSFMSDSNGNLSISATVPSSLAPGIHTLHITGKNFGGDDIDMFEIVYVAASATDFNGDGVPNDQDPCPSTTKSGVDVDQDGKDDACEGYVGTAPLYRARNGVTANGEDANLIYVDRNTSVASSLGISDSDSSGDGWVTIASTKTTDDATSAVANFAVTDTGLNPSNAYSRYVPYLSTRTSNNGCVELSPASLAPTSDGAMLGTMSLVASNSSTCRSQAPDADANNNSIPDNQEQLYRARNGNSANGEDPSAIYIERNTTAAEAILGISDYDPNSDGWSSIGVTTGTNNGTYNHLVLADSTGATIAESGIVPTDKLHSMTTAQLRTIKPVVIDMGSNCQAVNPASVDVVTNSSLLQVNAVAVPLNETCVP